MTRYNSSQRRYKTTLRKLRNVGSNKLEASFQEFVINTPGFNKNSYGEIRFKGWGSCENYAPFVTCCAKTASPKSMIRLLTEKWMIPFPKAIISINGEFPKRDYSWSNVMNEAMLITTGSAPSHQKLFDFSTIGIVDKNLIDNKDSLWSESIMGLFPVAYRPKKHESNTKSLDPTHTHFIFVEGDSTSIANFRNRLLYFLGTMPMTMDAKAVSFVNTPIVSILVSEDADALINFSRDINSGYPAVIAATAPVTTHIMKIRQTSRDTLTEDHLMMIKGMNKIDPTTRQNILSSLNQCKSVLFYSANGITSLKQILLQAIIGCPAYNVLSSIQLSMIWDCMDILRALVDSRAQFEGNNDFLSVYLMLALSLDRAEFLEYLYELEIDFRSKLTVKKLWLLYYEALFNDRFETDTSFIIRRFVQSYGAKDASDLLNVVERFISRLTKHEVHNLYLNKVYSHPSCNSKKYKELEGKRFLPDMDDVTPCLRHANRDLFIWCILFGKFSLAKLFWRSGSNYAASALIASAILRGQAESIDFHTQDSALAEMLQENSKYWTQMAVDFVDASFKEGRRGTLCLLTQRVKQYGDCSVLDLAFVTKNVDFSASQASQFALDHIWRGKTHQDLPMWKKLFALIFPFLIPCLKIVDRRNYFAPSQSQTHKATFAVENEEEDIEESVTGLGEVVYKIQTMSRKSQNSEHFLKSEDNGFPSLCANAAKDIFDYYDSPSIKFYVHSMFLFCNMVMLSLILTLNIPPYFSINSSNILMYLVALYMLGIAIDEIRQVLTQDNESALRKFVTWVTDGWNRIDFYMVTCYFSGVILTVVKPAELDVFVIKIFFAVTLLFMVMRCFQLYLVFPFLGPKIYMMKEMMRDVRTFLSIMALVFFCYGIISEGFYGESDESRLNISSAEDAFLYIYNRIFRKPYWQVYVSAVDTDVMSQNDLRGAFSAMVTAFYVLFANLLMINLLIAMFSYTFQTIQDNATIYWKFHRFEVVKEFWDRPWLPSPAIIIEDIVRTLQWFSNRTKRRNQAFKRSVTREQEELLRDFEKEVQTLLTEREKEATEKEEALHNDIKKILLQKSMNGQV